MPKPQDSLACPVPSSGAACTQLEAHPMLGLRDPAFLLAYRMTGRVADAEDVVQEAFLRALREGWPERGAVAERARFLGRVAQVARDQRKLGARRLLRERRAGTMRGEQSLSGESQSVMRTDLRQQLAEALQCLEEKLRLAVSLHFEQGLSYAEAAQVLQEREGTLRVRAHRGVRRLRALLSQRGCSLAPAAVEGLLGAGLGVQASVRLAVALEGLAASGGKAGAYGSLVTAPLLPGVAKAGVFSIASKAGLTAALALAAGAALVWTDSRLPGAGQSALGAAHGGPRGPEQTGEEQAPAPVAAQASDPLTRPVTAVYRREHVGEVLADLRERAGVRVAFPATLAEVGLFSLEAKGVPAREVLEKLAQAHGLRLESAEGVQWLWRDADEKELAALQAELGAGEAGKRGEAVLRLARLADRRIYPLLFRALKDADPAVAGWAAWGLLRHLETLGRGEGAGEMLKTLVAWDLKPPEPLQLGDLARLMGATRQKEALRELRIFVLHKEVRAREGAAEALGLVGSPECEAPLMELLKDTDREVAQAAARSLGRLRDPQLAGRLVKELERASGNFAQRLIEALGELRDPAGIEPVAKFLAQTAEDPDPAQLLQGIRDLAGGDGDPAEIRRRMMANFDNPAARTYMIAALALSRMGDARGLPVLSAKLEEEQGGGGAPGGGGQGRRGGGGWQGGMRSRSLLAILGQTRRAEALEPLLKRLGGDRAWEQAQAASVLTDQLYRDPRVAAGLRAQLEKPAEATPADQGPGGAGNNPGQGQGRRRGFDEMRRRFGLDSRRRIYIGAGRNREEGTFEKLAASLKVLTQNEPAKEGAPKPDLGEAVLVLEGLAELRDPRAVDLALELLAHSDKRIRAAAAGFFVTNWASAAEAGLRKLLEDPEAEVKRAAAEALFHGLSAAEALKLLLAQLPQGDPDLYSFLRTNLVVAGYAQVLAIQDALKQHPPKFPELNRMMDWWRQGGAQGQGGGQGRGGRGAGRGGPGGPGEGAQPAEPPPAPKDGEF